MANPSASRERGFSKRARKGPVRMWEDTIVEAMDNNWRSRMGACKNSVEWLGITRLAIEDLIHKWKLPKSTLPSKDKVWIRIEEKKTTDAQQFLMLEDTADYTGGRV